MCDWYCLEAGHRENQVLGPASCPSWQGCSAGRPRQTLGARWRRCEQTTVTRLRLPYQSRDAPEPVRCLTCGVDVQKNRLIYVIRGWAPRATSWLIQHGELWGSTDDPAVWTA